MSNCFYADAKAKEMTSEGHLKKLKPWLGNA